MVKSVKYSIYSEQISTANLHSLRTPIKIIKMHIRLLLIQSMKPLHPITSKLLHLRLQLITLNVKIIHRPNPRNQHSRISRTHTVHQGATVRAEIIAHGVARVDGFVLRKLLELVLAADMGSSGFFDDEVGGEGRSADFVAVGAVADEGADHVWAFYWLDGW